MADYLEVTLTDGTTVLFQAAESDFVRAHSSDPDVEKVEAAMGRLQSIALATGSVCSSFREKLAPDELELEIGVGLSGEVGWFFAKSEAEATMKVKLVWKNEK